MSEVYYMYDPLLGMTIEPMTEKDKEVCEKIIFILKNNMGMVEVKKDERI